MTLTSQVYDVVKTHDGVSCSDIMKAIPGLKQNVAAGTLSRLKSTHRAYNEDSLWYAKPTKTSAILKRLIAIDSGKWHVGYISALIDYQIIDRYEAKDLLDCISLYKETKHSSKEVK